MTDLSSPLTPEELDELDQALLDRFDEGDENPPGDEGVYDVSGLDGFLTAVLCSPVLIMPSRWLPAVWGDYPPLIESEKEFERLFSLMIRQSNEIADLLMNDPDGFEPLFFESDEEDEPFLIVDEWCEGFMRGLALIQAHGVSLDDEVESFIFPIRAFTQAADWPGHRLPDFEDTEELQFSIAPSVCALHAYWVGRHMDPVDPPDSLFLHYSAPAGLDDPCPCGSGKIFRKCCLH
jgi:uncharacterized protein